MKRLPKRRRRRAEAAEGASLAGMLTADERRVLVETSLELVEKLYVHLPLKRSMYAVNPLQRLRLLRRRLALPSPLRDRDFYNEMLGIFSQLRDLHTAFVLPEPLRSTTAYLPFRLEACREKGRRAYLVSHVMDELPTDCSFRKGVVVTHWNGIPIDRAVALNAERESGSNAAARHAQGLGAMTVRWLGQSLPPDEEWVDVRYRPGDSRTTEEHRFVWNVFEQQTGDSVEHTIARAQGEKISVVGMDARGEVERQVRRCLFEARSPRALKGRAFGGSQVPSSAPDVFPACGDFVTKDNRKVGYIRIATFNVDDDEPFLQEFIRLTGQISQDGLILDVRGNTGGLIHAGERLLQLLTPQPIDPARFQFLNSVRTQRLTERHAEIGRWKDSIGQAVETGNEYSQGFSLLPAAQYNDIGQTYQGPVVLVTDALCYSTTDIFAAGFQDHRIGKILGVDENTGAGGANVWEYPLIAALLGDPASLPPTLPRNASFRFAVRRVTRVGENAGVLLEDLGVRPDELHEVTRRDILDHNLDLLTHAAKLLSRMPRQHLRAERRAKLHYRITASNIDRVDAFLDDRPLTSKKADGKPIELTVPARCLFRGAKNLCLHGFRKGQLVAATRSPLR